MTIPVLTVLFAIMAILITKAPVAFAMNQQKGGYDNRYPRDQQQLLTGVGKRALSAHINSIEALPIFIAGLFSALYFQADESLINICCLAFVAARTLFAIFYWLNIHLLRSLSWGVAFTACCALVVAPLLK